MNERDEYLRQMGEASALDPDDPDRRAVERRIAGQSWAEDQWRDLVLESDRLRTELPRVAIPSDLDGRLLRIGLRRTGSRVFQHAVWALPLAATVLVIAGVATTRNSVRASRMNTVAILAINNHLNHLGDHHLDDPPVGREELEKSLSEELSFPVTLPELDSDLEFVGGRKCKLGSHEVAFSLWANREGSFSLFQFEAADFGLSSRISRTLVRTAGPAAAGHPGGAWIWSDGSSAYVLAGDPGVALDDLFARHRSRQERSPD